MMECHANGMGYRGSSGRCGRGAITVRPFPGTPTKPPPAVIRFAYVHAAASSPRDKVGRPPGSYNASNPPSPAPDQHTSHKITQMDQHHRSMESLDGRATGLNAAVAAQGPSAADHLTLREAIGRQQRPGCPARTRLYGRAGGRARQGGARRDGHRRPGGSGAYGRPSGPDNCRRRSLRCRPTTGRRTPVCLAVVRERPLTAGPFSSGPGPAPRGRPAGGAGWDGGGGGGGGGARRSDLDLCC